MIDDKKREFAHALLRYPDDPLKAARAVFPGNAGRAFAVARKWPSDPFVIETIEDVPDDEADALGVPSKNALAREAWRRVRKTKDHETAFKGIETIALDALGVPSKNGLSRIETIALGVPSKNGLSRIETIALGVPSKNGLAREVWRRVQKTNDPETAFKGIEIIRKLL